jgi:hypothetical protein
MADTMMGADGKPYIWLRYTTQFTANGRTHTIEMGIPMPLGASAETREQLIREAEAGMDQLSRHVEHRVNQVLQRNVRPQSTTVPSAPTPHVRPSPPPAPATAQTNPRDVAQTPATEKKETLPPARQAIGASMPVSPNQLNDVTGNMKLSQFILFIRENWSLTPKEAMELLNVKTLNGLNYRDALKQLQQVLAARETHGTTTTSPDNPASAVPPSKAADKPSPATVPPSPTPLRPPSHASTTPVASAATPSRSAAPPSQHPISNPTPSAPSSNRPVGNAETPAQSKIPIIPIRSDMIRDTPNAYRFDEEEEEEIELDLDEADFANGDLRLRAREKLDRLKEAGGSTAVSPSRLTVLNNLTSSQISETQLQQLIRAVWKAASVKKLKVDQAEALISWAKEDDFENEVRAVLALLEEEESYAGSDW